MATVAERLASAHDELLTLYTTIPVLTPCLDSIKTNQAQFVTLNNSIRQLQEEITTSHGKADRLRKQLDWAFKLGKKADIERQYQLEVNRVKYLELERRKTLRKRDDVVTVRYKLHSDRDKLLHMTRQLKKLTESVFDRSKDPVANADFPEELYWQLELKECDEKIGKCRQELSKFQIALTALSRAANLSEAALMAFLGYTQAAYKVWSAEYALQASRKMRLYLRVELSLSNAYSNFQSARAAVPSTVMAMDVPMPASSVQEYFEHTGRTGLGRKLGPLKPFDKEPELRAFIGHLRSCHKSVERIVEQNTVVLNTLTKYRDSIVPQLAKIRRHAFQDSCLDGYNIEGWEDENGRSLLGTEADVLVRGGVIEVHESSARVSAAIAEAAAEAAAAAASGSFMPVALSMNGGHDRVDPSSSSSAGRHHNRRSSRSEDVDSTNGGGVNASSQGGPGAIMGHAEAGREGEMIIRVGRAPLSTVVPNNQLGSQVLMEVDRDRRARAAAAAVAAASSNNSSGSIRTKFWRRDGSRSRSRSRARSRSTSVAEGGHGNSGEQDTQEVLNSPSQRRRGSGQHPMPPSFSLSRISSIAEGVVGPTAGTTTNDPASNSGPSSSSEAPRRPTHRHNVPSLSISHADDIGGGTVVETIGSELRPRVMSMDEYVGVGEVERAFDEGHTDVDMPLVYAYLDSTTANHHRSLPAASPSISALRGDYIPFTHNGRSLSVSTLNPHAEYGSDLIPTYGEHRRHRPLNPEDVFLMAAPPTASFGSAWVGEDQPPPFSETNDISYGNRPLNTLPPTPPLSSSSLSSVSSTSSNMPTSLHRLRSRSLSPSANHRMPLLNAYQLGSPPSSHISSGLGANAGITSLDALGRTLGSNSDDHLNHLEHHHFHHLPPPEYTA
ncbi:hypothetical protein BGZ73_007205 [Actinomortierella ambigua]|nr:hypothetical protein BGZ73_007205 [Actinomortierella ambigua]